MNVHKIYVNEHKKGPEALCPWPTTLHIEYRDIQYSIIQLFSFLIFHQLAVAYTLRFFIAETLHLVFFVFRV